MSDVSPNMRTHTCRYIKYFYIFSVFSRTKKILVSFFISRFLFHRSISDKRTFIFTQRDHPSVDLLKPVSPMSRKSVTKYSISRMLPPFSYFYSKRKKETIEPHEIHFCRRWYYNRNQREEPIEDTSGHYIVRDGSLIIQGVQENDAGSYMCIASNSEGTETLEVRLTVSAPLSVLVQPAIQTVDLGKPAHLVIRYPTTND